MERTTWGQINELFEAARRLPADEREAWVRAATTDERVQSEVLSLLEAHEDDPWFVEETGGRRTPVRVTPAGTWLGKRTPIPPGSTPAQVAPGRAASTPSGLPRPRHAPEPKAGGQFATYRLVREMFRDPARIVFEAVAAGGSAHPRVALHVLAADAHEPAFAALLHAQGGILAHLDHPGIPRLIDGGVTGDGTAYLAFEYVAGAPIDAWCRERGLTVADRVGRVLAVCEAVQHAHEHLVAHSDLRPSNVLVPADATVRLLDCGMSRFLEFDLSPGGPGAPVHQYMSPEQARGEVLTTASDVYGLGILLYTLATGYPPYDLGGQTPPRARRTICDSEVEVPSAVADGRDQRRLAGTLDRIILKALRKNPRERYATAAALAADLRAWRDGRPASVVPATRWSRAMTGGWRAVRAGAVAIAVLAPLAGAGLLGWQAYVFRGERDRARAGLAEAERQARAAEERAAEERAAEERAAPRPVAELRLELAAAANDMALAERRGGNLPGAEALWAQSLADVRPVLDADPGNLRALAHVAAVRTSLGSLVRSQRRFEESLVQYREALRARERATAADDTPEAALALADARTSVARLLLDLVEVRRPGPNDAARLREASALLAQAGPVVRTAAASPAQQDALAELDRQSARLSRLTSRRR
jgi:tetratricopeptide (TPR) repeat protein